MTDVFIKSLLCGKSKTQGRAPCDKEGRDLSCAAARQGMPKFAGKPPGARKSQGSIPPWVSEGP